MPRASLLALVFILAISAPSTATSVCNVQGLGMEYEKFELDKCEGELDYETAIKCVNRKAEAEEKQRLRTAAAQSQAKCLCEALNEVAGMLGRYDTLNGRCLVDR